MNLNIRLADGVDLIESTVPRCGGDGVRVSAPVRYPCAAERRLTVTGPSVHRRVHTSFPCSLK